MNVSLLNWCVIVLAVLAANLPFFNQKLFALVPLSKSAAYRKPIGVRLLELIALYFAVGALACFFEAYVGNVFAQGWEFYAITTCLFLVSAYPGYVMHYLRKNRG